MYKKTLSLLLSICLVWTSGGVVDAALTAPGIFAGPSNLPQLQLQPPGQLGRIADYFNASTGNGKLVILIQDLHTHYGVQKNIAGLLDFLAGKLPHEDAVPFALAVEGASGPIDSSVMALFPDKKIKLAASDYLMRQGELTGAEYFAIQQSLPNLLVGAENERYYTVHRDLFRKTLSDREELVKTLKGLQRDINELPRYVYHKNKALLDFQAKVDGYDKGEMSTHEFIGLLVSMTSILAASGGTPIDLKSDFPALAAFAANSRFGTMEQVRAATAAFLTQTQSTLSAEEKNDLKVLAKNRGTATYYLYVRELVYQKKLFMAVPPALAQYMEYLHTAQTMGMDRVTHEAREMAFRVKLGLAGRGNAGDLVQVQHDLDLLLRLADLQATEYEVRDFAPRLNQFVALTKALLVKSSSPAATGRGSIFDESKIRRLISSSIDYYVMALMRNKPMIENTLRLIGRDNDEAGQAGLRAIKKAGHPPIRKPEATITRRSDNPPSPSPAVAILVAGGFHTVQLTNLLREKNISYLVITPNVEKVTDADRDLYVKRLSGDHLKVEQVLADSRSRDASGFKSQVARLKSLLGGNDAKSLQPGIRYAGSAVIFIVALFAMTAHGAPLDAAHLHSFSSSYPAWIKLTAVAAALGTIFSTVIGPSGPGSLGSPDAVPPIKPGSPAAGADRRRNPKPGEPGYSDSPQPSFAEYLRGRPEMRPDGPVDARPPAAGQPPQSGSVAPAVPSPQYQVLSAWAALKATPGKAIAIAEGMKQQDQVVGYRFITRGLKENDTRPWVDQVRDRMKDLDSDLASLLRNFIPSSEAPENTSLFRNLHFALENVVQHVLPTGGEAMLFIVAADPQHPETSELWGYVVDSGNGMDLQNLGGATQSGGTISNFSIKTMLNNSSREDITFISNNRTAHLDFERNRTDGIMEDAPSGTLFSVHRLADRSSGAGWLTGLKAKVKGLLHARVAKSLPDAGHETGTRVPPGENSPRVAGDVHLAQPTRPHGSLIKLMGTEKRDSIRAGVKLKLENAAGESVEYTIQQGPFAESDHPKVRLAKTPDGKKVWLTFDMNSQQYDALAKLENAAATAQGLWRGRLMHDQEGHPFYVVPNIEGQSLASYVAVQGVKYHQGGLNAVEFAADIARILARVARILHGLHGFGILYVDIHPGNIYVADDGSVSLLPDFDLSTFHRDEGGVPDQFRATDIQHVGEDVLGILEKLGLDQHPDLMALITLAKRANDSNSEQTGLTMPQLAQELENFSESMLRGTRGQGPADVKQGSPGSAFNRLAETWLSPRNYRIYTSFFGPGWETWVVRSLTNNLGLAWATLIFAAAHFIIDWLTRTVGRIKKVGWTAGASRAAISADFAQNDHQDLARLRSHLVQGFIFSLPFALTSFFNLHGTPSFAGSLAISYGLHAFNNWAILHGHMPSWLQWLQTASLLPAYAVTSDALSPVANNRSLENVLQENGLQDHPEVAALFDPLVAQALIADPVLRPVFMMVFPDNEQYLGALENTNENVLADIGGRQILNDHSGFTVGSLETVSRLAQNHRLNKANPKIIVGVTDRYYAKSQWPVANNRQVYFPLTDGTWLGVKGIGQLSDDSALPFRYDSKRHHYEGLVAKYEAVNPALEMQRTDARFLTLLGMRPLHRLVTREGDIVEALHVKYPKGHDVNPYLVFNRALSPHRISKLGQLLEADPTLRTYRAQVGSALGLATVPAPGEFMAMIMEQMGRQEAMKLERNFFKITLHMQDITLAGEETDNEEFTPYARYVELLHKKFGADIPNVRNLAAAISLAHKLRVAFYAMSQVSKAGQSSLFFPDPYQSLVQFASVYFSNLPDADLAAWQQPTTRGSLTQYLANEIGAAPSYGILESLLALKDPSLGRDPESALVETFRRQAIAEIARRTEARGSLTATTRVLPESMALAGRSRKNHLEGDISGRGLRATSEKMKVIFAGIEPTEVARLKEAAARQKLQFYIVTDPNGAFIRRVGNKILVNDKRAGLKANVRLTGLIHDIEGHDWASVEQILGRPYDPADADIYEAYAMALAEFRNIPNRQKRIEAVIGAFNTLTILSDEDSSKGVGISALGAVLGRRGIPAGRLNVVRESLANLLAQTLGSESASVTYAAEEFNPDPSVHPQVLDRLKNVSAEFRQRFMINRQLLFDRTEVSASDASKRTILHFKDPLYKPHISTAIDVVAFEMASFNLTPADGDFIEFVVSPPDQEDSKTSMSWLAPFRHHIRIAHADFVSDEAATLIFRDLISETGHAVDEWLLNSIGSHRTNDPTHTTNPRLSDFKLGEALELLRKDRYGIPHLAAGLQMLTDALMKNIVNHELVSLQSENHLAAVEPATSVQVILNQFEHNPEIRERLGVLSLFLMNLERLSNYPLNPEQLARARKFSQTVHTLAAGVHDDKSWKAARKQIVTNLGESFQTIMRLSSEAAIQNPLIAAEESERRENISKRVDGIAGDLNRVLQNLWNAQTYAEAQETWAFRALRGMPARTQQEQAARDLVDINRLGWIVLDAAMNGDFDSLKTADQLLVTLDGFVQSLRGQLPSGNRGRSAIEPLQAEIRELYKMISGKDWPRNVQGEPESLALAGRHGKNQLDWPDKPVLVKPSDSRLDWLWKDLNPAEIDRLRGEIKRQGIQLYLPTDAAGLPDGALMKRTGNRILINNARPEIAKPIRLTALIHEIDGHDWDSVARILGRPYSENDAGIYEAYAMALGEFRHIQGRRQRIQAVLNAFHTLAIIEDSSPAADSPNLGGLLPTRRLDGPQREKITAALGPLLDARLGKEDAPATPASAVSDEDAFQRFKQHLTDLTELEMVPKWTDDYGNYFQTTVPPGDRRGRWWMTASWDWLEKAAGRASDQTVFAAQVADILAAIDVFRQNAVPSSKGPEEAAREVLAARLRMLRYETGTDLFTILPDELNTFAEHFPHLKTPMLDLIGRIGPYIYGIPKLPDLHPDRNTAVYSEMALQAIGAQKSYAQTATAILKREALRLKAGSAADLDPAKGLKHWTGLLENGDLSPPYVLAAGVAMARELAAAAALSKTPKEFEQRAGDLFAAHQALGRRLILHADDPDDHEIARHLVNLLATLVEHRQELTAADLRAIGKLGEASAGNLSKPFKAAWKKATAELKSAPSLNPVEAAKEIRKALALVRPRESAKFLTDHSSDQAPPAAIALIDRAQLKLETDSKVRGERLLKAYVQEIIRGTIDLADAENPGLYSAGGSQFNYFSDHDAYVAIQGKIEFYASTAKRSDTRQDFAKAIREIEEDEAILNAPMPQFATAEAAWDHMRKLVSVNLKKYKGQNSWSDAFPYPNASHWGYVLQAVDSHAGHRVSHESFIKVEITLPLQAAMTGREKDRSEPPGRELSPNDYAEKLLKSMQRPRGTQAGSSPRERGLDAMVKLAKAAASDHPPFHIADYYGWMYALNDIEANQAVYAEIAVVRESGRKGYHDMAARIAEEVAEAARVLDAAKPSPKAGDDIETAKKIIKAQLTYLRYQSSNSHDMLGALTTLLSPENRRGGKVMDKTEPYATLIEAITVQVAKATTGEWLNTLSGYNIAMQAMGLQPSYARQAHDFFVGAITALNDPSASLDERFTSRRWNELFKEQRKDLETDKLLSAAVELEAMSVGPVGDRDITKDRLIADIQSALSAWHLLTLVDPAPGDPKAILERFNAILVLLQFHDIGNDSLWDHAQKFAAGWFTRFPDLKEEANKQFARVTAGLKIGILPRSRFIATAQGAVEQLLAGKALPSSDELIQAGRARLSEIVREVQDNPGLLAQAAKPVFWLERFKDPRAYEAVDNRVAYFAIAAERNAKDHAGFIAASNTLAGAYDTLVSLGGKDSASIDEATGRRIAAAKVELLGYPVYWAKADAVNEFVRVLTGWNVPEDIRAKILGEIDARLAATVKALTAYAAVVKKVDTTISANDYIHAARQSLGMEPTLNQQARDGFAAIIEPLRGGDGTIPTTAEGWRDLLRAQPASNVLLMATAEPLAQALAAAAGAKNAQRPQILDDADAILSAWGKSIVPEAVPTEANARRMALLDRLDGILTLMNYGTWPDYTDAKRWKYVQTASDEWFGRLADFQAELKPLFDEVTAGLDIAGLPKTHLLAAAHEAVGRLRAGEKLNSPEDLGRIADRNIDRIVVQLIAEPQLLADAYTNTFWLTRFDDPRAFTLVKSKISFLQVIANDAKKHGPTFKQDAETFLKAWDRLYGPAKPVEMGQEDAAAREIILAELAIARYLGVKSPEDMRERIVKEMTRLDVTADVQARVLKPIDLTGEDLRKTLDAFGRRELARKIPFSAAHYMQAARQALGVQTPYRQQAHDYFLALAAQWQSGEVTPVRSTNPDSWVTQFRKVHGDNPILEEAVFQEARYFANASDMTTFDADLFKNYAASVLEAWAKAILAPPAPAEPAEARQEALLTRLDGILVLMRFETLDMKAWPQMEKLSQDWVARIQDLGPEIRALLNQVTAGLKESDLFKGRMISVAQAGAAQLRRANALQPLADLGNPGNQEIRQIISKIAAEPALVGKANDDGFWFGRFQDKRAFVSVKNRVGFMAAIAANARGNPAGFADSAAAALDALDLLDGPRFDISDAAAARRLLVAKLTIMPYQGHSGAADARQSVVKTLDDWATPAAIRDAALAEIDAYIRQAQTALEKGGHAKPKLEGREYTSLARQTLGLEPSYKEQARGRLKAYLQGLAGRKTPMEHLDLDELAKENIWNAAGLKPDFQYFEKAYRMSKPKSKPLDTEALKNFSSAIFAALRILETPLQEGQDLEAAARLYFNAGITLLQFSSYSGYVESANTRIVEMQSLLNNRFPTLRPLMDPLMASAKEGFDIYKGDYEDFAAKAREKLGLPILSDESGQSGDELGGRELSHRLYKPVAHLWEWIRPLAVSFGIVALTAHFTSAQSPAAMAAAILASGSIAVGTAVTFHALGNREALKGRGIWAMMNDTAVVSMAGAVASAGFLAGSPIVLILGVAATVGLSIPLLIKHYRLNYKGAYNLSDGAPANESTIASILHWLARRHLGMPRKYFDLQMNGLHLAVAKAGQVTGTPRLDGADLNDLTPPDADLDKQRADLLNNNPIKKAFSISA